tara:strand:- start:4339 stop:5004 length:666 start_codon:yes stop_codon:yes gene_type:complete
MEEIPDITNLGNSVSQEGSDENQTSCDNILPGQPCANKTKCLRHQAQSFQVTFNITTEGGPLIDPSNYHELWKSMAGKSRRHATTVKPILKGTLLSEEKLKTLDKDEKCSICLSEFETGQLVTETLCGHMFHKRCLRNYFEREARYSLIYKCPLCRKYLTCPHKVTQNFHIKSHYQMRGNTVICDQNVYDFTPRIYNRVRRNRRTRRVPNIEEPTITSTSI